MHFCLSSLPHFNSVILQPYIHIPVPYLISQTFLAKGQTPKDAALKNDKIDAVLGKLNKGEPKKKSYAFGSTKRPKTKPSTGKAASLQPTVKTVTLGRDGEIKNTKESARDLSVADKGDKTKKKKKKDKK